MPKQDAQKTAPRRKAHIKKGSHTKLVWLPFLPWWKNRILSSMKCADLQEICPAFS